MRYVIAVRGVAAAFIVLASLPSAADSLSLMRAETLALERAPALARERANVAAASERVVHEGRLPDPTLTLSAINVPTDNFSLTQDDMTMLGVGLRQAFPPGQTLDLRSRRAAAALTRDEARLEAERRNVLRQVRRAWFDTYAAERLLELHQEEKRVAQRDLDATESRYRAAQEAQRAVLRARSTFARVHERESMLQAKLAQARAALARFIGEAAYEGLPATPPALEPPAEAFDATLHPEYRAAAGDTETMATEVALAREDYKPGYMVDVMYGVRADRADMITAQVGIDLPLFRAKRQDRRLAERERLQDAASASAEDKRRELMAMYDQTRAEHAALRERLRLYERELLPALRREAAVTIAGFGRDQTELREARMRELEARAEHIRLQTELTQTQVELLYLTGDTP